MDIKNDEAIGLIQKAFTPLRCEVEQAHSGEPIKVSVRGANGDIVRENDIPFSIYRDRDLLAVFIENEREAIGSAGHKLDALRR
jgi:hypothetical protein